MDKYEYLWMKVRNNLLPGDISENGMTYEEIFSLSEKGLIEKCGLSKKQAEFIINKVKETDIEGEFELFNLSGVSAVTVNDDKYPKKLINIENRPFALFYKGELPDENKRSVAIIGSRKCTEYGKYMAENIATGLAKYDVEIISGMAFGIDGIAGMAALNSGARSFGVLGSGANVCYPRANKALYDRLCKDGGIITEYPVDACARADNFPLRNRIISALSDVVLVVEAGLKSGTFITVDYALSQGREIMVVPGRATDPLSVGCNALILQGASPAQSADDVMRLLDTVSTHYYEYNFSRNDFRTKELIGLVPKKSEKVLLEREENMVYSVLDFYSKNTEDIMKATNLDIFQIMSVLISLEMRGLIKETGKNSYVKCR